MNQNLTSEITPLLSRIRKLVLDQQKNEDGLHVLPLNSFTRITWMTQVVEGGETVEQWCVEFI